MIDKKTDHLGLPLPSELNQLEDDCPRIAAAFRGVDAHAANVDGRLDGVEAGVSSLEARSAQNEADITRRGEEAAAYAAQTDAALGWVATRATALENRTTELEGGVASLEARAQQDEAELARLEQDKATKAALAAHDADKDSHNALVQRITVGSLSPVIGVCCVEEGGGSGLWFNIDANGQPLSPTKSYFDYHPTYNALRRVLVDGQVMQEHSKFYYKAFQIASGPFAGRRGRLISPGQQDGFKPYPSFMSDGQEIDKWYCGTYAGTNEGGSPVKIGSRPGKVPIVNVNFPTMQGYCTNRNTGGVTGFDMWNIYQASELQLLALIEAATPDTQAVYGRGRVDTSSANYVDATDVATASWRGHVGLWGNVWQMCAGLDVTTSGVLRLWKNDGSKTFVETGFVCPAYDGTNAAYMVKLKTGKGTGWDFDDIFFPETTSTSAAAGTIPDGFWGRSGGAGNVLYLGANWGNAGLAGLFACYLTSPATYSDGSIGCRLAKV